jgi:hypothetical protein
MKKVCSAETSINFYQITQRHMPGGSIIRSSLLDSQISQITITSSNYTEFTFIDSAPSHELIQTCLLSISNFLFIPVKPPICMCCSYHLRTSRKFVRDIDKLPFCMSSIPQFTTHTIQFRG